jgi:hypothetical protein
VLAFTDRYGRVDWVPGADLGVILSNAPVRLALLNSCDGARVSEVDPYATTAIALVENGIPAVVAMQFEISDKAAIAFSNATYLALTSSQPVDAAVTLARQAILTTSRNEWATPVLYLRATDGTLFAWDRDVAQETARVEALSAPLPQPVALQAASGPRGLVLSWAPVAGDAAVRYEVYRDGALVGETAEPTFTDAHAAAGTPSSEPGPAYSVVAVDELGRRSPTSDEIGPPPLTGSTERHGRRRVPRAHLIGALVVLVVGVLTWVARGIVWPPDPTPPTPTPTTRTTGSTTTSPTTSPTTTTRTTSTTTAPAPPGLAVSLPRVALVAGAANQVGVLTQVRNLGNQASSAGRSLLVTVTGPARFVATGEGCAVVPGGLRCAVPVIPAGAASQRFLGLSTPPDGQPVTVTATLTPGDGGGDDSANRTFTCVKWVCDVAGPSPS